MEKLLTADDVCKALSVEKTTVYDWVYKKRIPVVKLGGLRFRESDIMALIDKNTKAPKPRKTRTAQAESKVSRRKAIIQQVIAGDTMGVN